VNQDAGDAKGYSLSSLRALGQLDVEDARHLTKINKGRIL
jgi:hypothetical protein